MLQQFWNDETGAVIAAELVLVLTILVIGVIVGLSEVAVAINTELNDISNAIGSLSQNFFFTGFHAIDGGIGGKIKSSVAGSRFTDFHESCDNNLDCDLVCGPPLVPTCG